MQTSDLFWIVVGLVLGTLGGLVAAMFNVGWEGPGT